MREERIRKKSRILPIALLLIIAAGLLLWAWQPWQDSVMFVKVTITTDSSRPAVVYSSRTPFLGSQGEHPTLTAKIDLAKWQGQLVRVDIRGYLRRRGDSSGQNYVGCFARLLTPGSDAPIEFIGWVNSGFQPYHMGEFGSPAYSVRGAKAPPLVYSKTGLLWHVLRAPQQGALQIIFKPVLASEVQGKTPLYLSLLVPPTSAPAPAPGPGSGKPASPDVFIYLCDALRADHLGAYGYPRNTSPNIDAFAKTSALFENANNTWTATLPSVATIMTGLYVSAHGCIDSAVNKIDPSLLLLSQALKGAGYHTASIVTNPYASAFYGFDRGNDKFYFGASQSCDWVNARAEEFLAKQPSGQPVFLYLHNLEPHSPYDPKPESRRLFDRGFKGKCDGSVKALEKIRMFPGLTRDDREHLIDLYDGDIHDNDNGFAAFLQLLQKYHRLEGALIIVVADHGESFGEQDTMEHGYVLGRQEMHVPLIVKFPGGRFAGERIKSRVSLIDVFPTVIAETGVRPKLRYALPGINLARFAGREVVPPRMLFAELYKLPEKRTIDLGAVIDESGYKRVMDISPHLDAGPPQKALGLWDTKVDPAEQRDLSRSRPVLAAYEEQSIALWMQRQHYWRGGQFRGYAPASRKLPEAIRRDLKSLGYLD
jgi:arylsulfatase A-like enzyme